MPFQKGQSGNPGGRPRREKSLTGALRAILEERDKHGEPYRVVMARKVLEMALAGNLDAIKMAYERLDGKPIERLEHSGPDGGPFRLHVTVVDDRDDAEPGQL